MELQVYVDASSFDDGVSKYGYIIRQGTITLAEGSGYYSVGGYNNVATEHIAADLGYRVIKLLTRRLEEVEKITLFTDEENIVKDKRRPQTLRGISHQGGVTKHYKIPIEYRWIPSKENPADALVSNPERRRKDAYFRSLREGGDHVLMANQQ